MIGSEHYAEAERLITSVREKLTEIEQAPQTMPGAPRTVPAVTSAAIALAQVHATLAVAASQAVGGLRW